MRLKLIFLDFDGVLNNLAHAIVLKQNAYRACEINKLALGLVRWVCNITEANIVVSSTWRHQGLNWINGVFEGHGWVHPPIFGVTPRGNTSFRGDQIQQYLDEIDHTVESYVCVDDDSDFYAHQPLVKTDPNIGFTFYQAIEVIDILGYDESQETKIKGIREHVNFQLNKQNRISSKLKDDM